MQGFYRNDFFLHRLLSGKSNQFRGLYCVGADLPATAAAQTVPYSRQTKQFIQLTQICQAHNRLRPQPSGSDVDGAFEIARPASPAHAEVCIDTNIDFLAVFRTGYYG